MSAQRASAILAAELTKRQPWRDLALYRGSETPEWWYPVNPAARTEAYVVCARCPVREECLEAGLSEARQNGIWGGKSPSERQRILGRQS